MTIFALRSAVVVATVMAIPDAVALIPSVSTVTSWILKLVACWTTALICWFLFCLGFLQLMRLIAGGVYVDGQGVKLWRYGRVVSFQSIEAIGLEPEHLFTTIFSFDRTVYRLTIFKRIEVVARLLKGLSIPVYIPSYLFKPNTFKTLVLDLVENKYGIRPSHFSYLSFPIENAVQVRRFYKVVFFQRMLLSILIGLGVTTFLVRKACVLYSYNEGLKEYRQLSFEDAQKSFAFSVGLDPTFAPGFHGLAGSLFSVGDFDGARANWEQALRWKPDYVEAKVSLAYLSLQNRDFERAGQLLKSALRIDPYNSEALLNKADLDLCKGHVQNALKLSRLIVAREEGRNSRDVFMARCLIAHARLIEGEPDYALNEISHLPVSKEKLKGGENLTYRLVVGSKIYLGLGENRKALRMAKMAMHRSCNVETLLLMAQIRIATGEYSLARNILKRCNEIMPGNPYVYELLAEIDHSNGDDKLALENLEKGEKCLPRDANSLVEIGRLYSKMGYAERAITPIELALRIEPRYPLGEDLTRIWLDNHSKSNTALPKSSN